MENVTDIFRWDKVKEIMKSKWKNKQVHENCLEPMCGECEAKMKNAI